MPELRGPPIRAILAKQRAHATLVADQIRRGQELLERLSGRAGRQAHGSAAYSRWHDHNESLLRIIVVSSDVSEAYLWSVYRRIDLRGRLRGADPLDDIRSELEDLESVASHLGPSGTGLEPSDRAEAREPAADGKILVVHGRNEAVKEKVTRFLMKLGLEPLLLEEQAAHGLTLIEKVEAYSPVAFAVVLLTGDDIGALAVDSPDLHPRARQNVIFELGFFFARLGRERVCALYEEGVELPSDFCGIEHKRLDDAGAWKARLAKELHEAGLKFDPINVL